MIEDFNFFFFNFFADQNTLLQSFLLLANSSMLRVQKPKNARSKRALEKRESKEKENVKKAIFVRGNKVSSKVSIALTQLSLLKKPDAISFSKKNEISPFEAAGQQSLEFWANKNDASLFLVGDDKKKRKDNLTWARIFDGKLLDLLEMQVLEAKEMTQFKVSKSRNI